MKRMHRKKNNLTVSLWLIPISIDSPSQHKGQLNEVKIYRVWPFFD